VELARIDSEITALIIDCCPSSGNYLPWKRRETWLHRHS